MQSDTELLNDFRVEALESLQQLEEQLLALEAGDPDALDVVSRSMHSIKGNSSFFDLVHVNSLAHELESLLVEVRDGQVAVDNRLADIMLQGCDAIRLMLQALPDGVEDGRAADIKRQIVGFLEEQIEDDDDAPPAASKVRKALADHSYALNPAQLLPHFPSFLLERRYLTAEQLLQALVTQAQTEPDEIDMLVQHDGLTQRQCIQIADHATCTKQTLFGAAVATGLLQLTDVADLRTRSHNARQTFAKVIVGLKFADRAKVESWPQEFLGHMQESS